MTVIANAGLVLKDSQGNEGIVKTLTDNDIIKIANAITDVGQVVDPATHMPIEATTASVGVVQLATAQDITNGTAGKVVDAKELINFAQTLPSVNGVTDVSSGDNSNQLVVSRIGGSKTLTIDNVEHAGNADEATHASQADTATSANSVAWDNVSGKPSSYTPSSHTHDDRYYTESEIDTKLSGKSDTTHNHNSAYLGITAKAESAKSADSVAWDNVRGKPTKVSQFTNDSGFLTSHQSLANYVTLNTAQTISGNKTFLGLTKTSGKVGYDLSGNDVNNAIYNMETTAWVPDTANRPSSPYGTLLSLNREVNVHTNPGIGWIVQFGISTDARLYLRTKTNIGSDWSDWREFITSSDSCNYANSAGSVAWGNVSGRPDIWIG